jgi:ABC-2 type transport system ATP-binding protein
MDFDEGEILINGKSIKKEPLVCKKEMAYISDDPELYEDMKAIDYINFVCDIYEVPSKVREPNIMKYAKMFSIEDELGNVIKSFSHGMKQKICMMGSLVHNPDLWILDEPMVGLDPRTQKAVTDAMKAYVASGKTILFSSHNLDVVKRICSRAIVINSGRVVADVPAETWATTENALEKYYFMEEIKADEE